MALNNMIKLIIGSMITFTGVYMVLTKLKSVGLYQKLFGSTNLLKATSGVTLGIVALILAVTSFAKAAQGGEEGAKAIAVGLVALTAAAVAFTIAGSPVLAILISIVTIGMIVVGTIQSIVQAFQHLSDRSVEIKNPLENLSNDFKFLKDTISGTTTSATTNFQNMSLSAGTEFGAVSDSVGSNIDKVDDYLNTDLKNYLDTSKLNFEDYKTSVSKSFDETNISGKNYIDNMKKNLISLDIPILSSKTSFENLNTTTKGVLENVDKEVSNKTSSMATSFKDMADKAKEYSDNTKTSLEGISRAEIKKPKFSWSSGNSNLSGALKSLLTSFGMETALPVLNVKWYATGGFPKKGELFVANENAPEMIGKMGNRNVVANNQQITQGIASAVYDAIVDANLGGDNGDTYVYVGDRQITDVITKRQKRNNDKFGR